MTEPLGMPVAEAMIVVMVGMLNNGVCWVKGD